MAVGGWTYPITPTIYIYINSVECFLNVFYYIKLTRERLGNKKLIRVLGKEA